MSFIICDNNEKIEVDINNENVQKSKLLIEFYDECKEGSELYIPSNMKLIHCLIKGNLKFDEVEFEIVYNFLNYLIVDDEVMIEYLSYKLYKIDFEDAKYYIENVIDKSFLKALEKKQDIIGCVKKNDIVGVFIGIKSGADVNIKNIINGYTALHYASWYGYIEVAKILLESGTDINAKDNCGWTALYRASWYGYIEVAKVLLESGADVNIKDEYGDTALDKASKRGHIEVVKVLLEYGADINAKDEDGKTALHRASACGHTLIVKLLHK